MPWEGMQGRKEAGQQGQEAPLGPPTCRAGGSLTCCVWRTDRILQQSVSPGRGWDRLGPCAQASTLLSPGAAAGGLEWVQTGLAVWPWASRDPSLCLQCLIGGAFTSISCTQPWARLGGRDPTESLPSDTPSPGEEGVSAGWADGSFVCVLQCVLRAPRDCQRPGHVPQARPALDEPRGHRRSPTKAPGILSRGLALPTAKGPQDWGWGSVTSEGLGSHASSPRPPW